MTEPLDFSKVGTKKPPIPGKPAPKKAPKVTRRMSGRPPVAAIVVVLVVVAGVGGYLLFGRSGGKSSTVTVTSSRFCELARTLDQLAPDEANGLPPATAKTAIDQLEPTARELRSVAPGSLRDDVSAALAALRDAAGGDAGAVKSAAYHRHRQNITDEIQRSCAVGVGGGE